MAAKTAVASAYGRKEERWRLRMARRLLQVQWRRLANNHTPPRSSGQVQVQLRIPNPRLSSPSGHAWGGEQQDEVSSTSYPQTLMMR